ncbi:MAG: universal stress protein [Verrucomicrobia bacterium]|nr:universal stress protein [Verrucomicrobiota bacterium]
MKIKPASRSGSVLMEMGPRDSDMIAESDRATTLAPFKIKSLLVPMDFSECSKKALRYALPFARQFGASLTLLYVAHIPYVGAEVGGIDYALIESQMRAGGIKELEKIAGEDVGAEIPTRTIVRVGLPHHEIVTTARELDVDLIIISTHGHTGFKHMFMGSTAEKVVRHAPCPVLVVREREHEFV